MVTIDLGGAGGPHQRVGARRRWAVTALAAIASTWLLDGIAAAGGVMLAGSGLTSRVPSSGLVVALVVSYLGWAAGLTSNLRANGRLLDATGVSTNLVSKLAHHLVAGRSAVARRRAAWCGYVATEAVIELPYVVGAFGAAAASSSIGGRDAAVFLVGANLCATAYELSLAAATRLYLRRRG